MYALFEEAGKFLAGRVMSEAESSMQLELDSGKRVKIKSAHVLLRFDKPQPAALIEAGHRLAPEIDLDLAWEFAPDADFGFAEFARDYFDASAGPERQAAALFRLFEAPHYFRRVGKGVFRKAAQETVQAALAAIERKKQQALQIQAWAQELVAGRCPEPVRDQLYRILFKPDKNAPEYKAVVEAARAAQRSPLELLQAAGAIDSPYQFHWRRFLFAQFPRGTGFAAVPVPEITETLPLAGVQAFSIDDSHTTEIDDALSVQGLGSGTVVLGIHIAAPALAFAPDSPLDRIARERLSTVYLPGWKITMLPDEVVQAFTLSEGRQCPALSLYVSVDEASLEIRSYDTRIERVSIVANLRHDQLDAVVTEEALTGPASEAMPFPAELGFAFRLARHLKAQREQVRGKPETFNRPDYSFKLDRGQSVQPTKPQGSERVSIVPRQRGAPLDLIVAEAMILANSHWGGWLARLGVPGIYRSQASLLPGVKVRMGTKALPHAGMGVPQYAWSTSPLRRYVDLVNQWQIVACVRHGATAPLAAPFKPKDATLFSVISSFDGAYTAYNAFQAGMERFWTLVWLEQNGVDELEALVMKDGLVRAQTLPLVLRAVGTENLPRGARVRVRLSGRDLLRLDAWATLTAQLEQELSAPSATPGRGPHALGPEGEAIQEALDEALEEALEEGGDSEHAIASGPLALAIEVGDACDPAFEPAPGAEAPSSPPGS